MVNVGKTYRLTLRNKRQIEIKWKSRTWKEKKRGKKRKYGKGEKKDDQVKI